MSSSLPSTLRHTDTHFVGGDADPFTVGGPGFGSNFFNALLATALFRCWHLILMFTAWATLVTCITAFKVHNLTFAPTLLTVLGTVLGFVVSYRTSSSFERYNEGRRYWSLIIFHCRTLARGVWFHVPDVSVTQGANDDEKAARTLVEKKTVLNLIEAFAVSVKHYLRGEEGIYYVDLYHLTKYLPAYALPAGLAPPGHLPHFPTENGENGLPLPNITRIRTTEKRTKENAPPAHPQLLPARNPPKWSIFDVWPFTALVKPLTKKGKKLGGSKAARERAKQGRGIDGQVVSHNIPLEITLYLSSYIAALQRRKVADVPTINLLLNSLNALVDSLSGLERILTTPIPFSYQIHLWTVCVVYCWALPFQLYGTLKWLTIPATAVVSFIFFGFLAAGEEIENPFGFDRNDLNLDHFTHEIIRVELASITSVPVPDPAIWAFDDSNDALFDGDPLKDSIGDGVTPEQWVKRGVNGMRYQLSEISKPNSKSRENLGHNPAQGEHGGNANAGQVGAAGAAGGTAGEGGGGGGGGGDS